ncbi:uncharacterized protein LOC135829115 [Sycon ciliatum]|uniref:uncharacterized protein LOC135829115 n=1 Tax=Sycon ciliatum TaxID=27933 RepID=UPI0031F6A45E
MLHSANFTDEEVQTAFVQAETLLNSRPLTTVGSDADDLVPLTPQQLHIGHIQVETAIEAAQASTTPAHPQRRWKAVQVAVDHIWLRWLKEFVPTLNIRQRWRMCRRNIMVADMVFYMAKDTPRGMWPLGKVVDVFPGANGLVRVMDILVKGKTYRRPTNLLVPLEFMLCSPGATQESLVGQDKD